MTTLQSRTEPALAAAQSCGTTGEAMELGAAVDVPSSVCACVRACALGDGCGRSQQRVCVCVRACVCVCVCVC